MQTVRCKSGLTGYQCRLQENYASLAEFEEYDRMYHLVSRLGYKTARGAWNANPMIQGSVEPSDFRKVRA
jgi:hypothetical protein